MTTPSQGIGSKIISLFKTSEPKIINDFKPAKDSASREVTIDNKVFTVTIHFPKNTSQKEIQRRLEQFKDEKVQQSVRLAMSLGVGTKASVKEVRFSEDDKGNFIAQKEGKHGLKKIDDKYFTDRKDKLEKGNKPDKDKRLATLVTSMRQYNETKTIWGEVYKATKEKEATPSQEKETITVSHQQTRRERPQKKEKVPSEVELHEIESKDEEKEASSAIEKNKETQKKRVSQEDYELVERHAESDDEDNID